MFCLDGSEKDCAGTPCGSDDECEKECEDRGKCRKPCRKCGGEEDDG